MPSYADQYRLLNKLGEGSFGVVYKASRKRDGQICAVKRINLEASDDEMIDFMKEISVMKLSQSEFIVHYYESFAHRHELWIVMEYMNAGSVADLIRVKPLPETIIAAVLKCMLHGLASLHADGKIHRDIKGGNVLLSKDGAVKLADFGVSTQMSDVDDRSWAGTPFWMAPEIIDQAGHDSRADIWSLGITAIEMAQGRPPGAGKPPLQVMRQISRLPPPRLPASARTSAEFAAFVKEALTKDYHKRPHATELLRHPFIQQKAVSRSELASYIVLRSGTQSLVGTEYAATVVARQSRAPPSGLDSMWSFGSVLTATRGETLKSRVVSVPDLPAYRDASTGWESLLEELRGLDPRNGDLRALAQSLHALVTTEPAKAQQALDLIRQLKLPEQEREAAKMFKQPLDIERAAAKVRTALGLNDKMDNISRMLLPQCLGQLSDRWVA